MRALVLPFLTIAAFFSLLCPLRAQEAQQLVDLSIQTSPITIQAERPVTLRVISYGIDLAQATIVWTYGGKTIVSGKGQTTATVVAPRSGSSAFASVSVSAPGLAPLSASILLNPGSIDLLWEGADAIVPPFYKGRALPAPGGLIRFVAIPANGAGTQASYEWRRNNNALPEASGLGKTSLTIQNTLFETQETIDVRGESPTFQGSATVTAPLQNPFAVIYKNKNGFVDYAKGSVGTVSITGEDAILRFEPFFFSVNNGLENDLVFSFSSGEETFFGEGRENELRLTRPDSGIGELDFSITTNQYSVQNISRTIRLLFQ